MCDKARLHFPLVTRISLDQPGLHHNRHTTTGQDVCACAVCDTDCHSVDVMRLGRSGYLHSIVTMLAQIIAVVATLCRQ